jgi:hypothetical protein
MSMASEAFQSGRRKAWTAAVLLALLPPTNMAAEGGWTAVLTVPRGGRVVVETASHERVRGELLAATPEGVTLAVDADVIAIDRSQVARLYVRRRMRRTVITGLLAGGAAGVLVGLGTTKTNRGSWALMLGSGWAAIGTLIGAIDGLFDAERLVYSATATTGSPQCVSVTTAAETDHTSPCRW